MGINIFEKNILDCGSHTTSSYYSADRHAKFVIFTCTVQQQVG